MEACLEAELPPASELEESLRTGVILCRLGHWMEPEVLPLRRIYDLDGAKFQVLLRGRGRGRKREGRGRRNGIVGSSRGKEELCSSVIYRMCSVLV